MPPVKEDPRTDGIKAAVQAVTIAAARARFDTDQLRFIDTVSEGKNVLLTGPAGTGKVTHPPNPRVRVCVFACVCGVVAYITCVYACVMRLRVCICVYVCVCASEPCTQIRN